MKQGPNNARAVGETLRDLRLRKGLSQERLAVLVGVDRGYLASLDRGEHLARRATIERLLPHLGVTFAEFSQAVQTRTPARVHPGGR